MSTSNNTSNSNSKEIHDLGYSCRLDLSVAPKTSAYEIIQDWKAGRNHKEWKPGDIALILEVHSDDPADGVWVHAVMVVEKVEQPQTTPGMAIFPYWTIEYNDGRREQRLELTMFKTNETLPNYYFR